MTGGKDLVPLAFSRLHRTPAEKGRVSNSQQAPLRILVMRMTLLFAVARLTFNTVCCTKCSVHSMGTKYILLKRLPLELCTVFNVK